MVGKWGSPSGQRSRDRRTPAGSQGRVLAVPAMPCNQQPREETEARRPRPLASSRPGPRPSSPASAATREAGVLAPRGREARPERRGPARARGRGPCRERPRRRRGPAPRRGRGDPRARRERPGRDPVGSEGDGARGGGGEDARGACTVAAAGHQRVPSARKWTPAVIARLVENLMLLPETGHFSSGGRSADEWYRTGSPGDVGPAGACTRHSGLGSRARWSRSRDLHVLP
jgi:hypothetical protein